jgi:hypothetical protein
MKVYLAKCRWENQYQAVHKTLEAAKSAIFAAMEKELVEKYGNDAKAGSWDGWTLEEIEPHPSGRRWYLFPPTEDEQCEVSDGEIQELEFLD